MTSTPFHSPFGGLVYDETRQKPGWYVARVVGLKARRSKMGNPMPTVEFETPATGHLYPLWCPLPPAAAKGFADDLEKFNQVLRASDMPAMRSEERRVGKECVSKVR